MSKFKGKLAKLRNNEFWVSVFKLSSGQIIGQGITLLATLVLSRIYTDSDYGAFGIITSTAAIIIGFISLALGSAIMVAKTDEESRRVFVVAFTVQMLLLIIVTAVILIISPFTKFFETTVNYGISVVLMAIYICVNILYTMMRIYINRLKMNDVLFWNSLITAGCTVFISIPFGLLKFGFIGLIISAIMASLLSSLHMIRNANPFDRIPRQNDFKLTFQDCRKFIFFQYPSNVMGTVSGQIPNQTLYSRFGDAALGTYGMCNRVFQMPMNLIIAPVQTVYFRTATQMAEEKEKLSDFSLEFIKKFMFIAVIPVIIVMSFGEYIFSFALGSQWSESGLIAAYMCLSFFFYFCNSCLAYLRVSIGKQSINLAMTIVQLASSLLAVFLSNVLNKNLINTIIIFSIINAIFNILDVFISFLCLKKNAIRYLLYSLAFSAICVFVSLYVRRLILIM